MFGDTGLRTLVMDINRDAMEAMAAGRLPFMEHGGEILLKKVLADRMLAFSSDVESFGQASAIIITVGTPIDEFQNPNYRS